MIIAADHINKSIGHQHILHDLSLNVEQGEVVGLLGPNGAGKSTLMKILVGLWHADSGSLQVCGVDMQHNSEQVKPKIGYLPENNPLYNEMYVTEYLLFLARLNNLNVGAKQRVEELLTKVGIEKEARMKIGQLSKGYRQRVGLAGALIPDPQLLVLDEPTTGLDPNQLDEIRTLIRDMADSTRTVILSTHIMQEVEAMCDRAVIINSGQICYDSTQLHDLETTFRRLTARNP